MLANSQYYKIDGQISGSGWLYQTLLCSPIRAGRDKMPNLVSITFVLLQADPYLIFEHIKHSSFCVGLCIGAACQCSIYASTFYTQLFVLFNIFNSHKINLNQRWTAKKRCVYKLQSVLVPALRGVERNCSTRSYFIVIFPIQK